MYIVVYMYMQVSLSFIHLLDLEQTRAKLYVFAFCVCVFFGAMAEGAFPLKQEINFTVERCRILQQLENPFRRINTNIYYTRGRQTRLLFFPPTETGNKAASLWVQIYFHYPGCPGCARIDLFI